MRFNSNISFAKQLIIYLLIILVIVFLFILLVLSSSLGQFISSNANSQAQVIATNVLTIFDREISRIENIPATITTLQGYPNKHNLQDLPENILKMYPTLTGCTMYYNPANPDFYKSSNISAIRKDDGSISRITSPAHNFTHSEMGQSLRTTHSNGYWVYSKANDTKTIAYCQTLYDKDQQVCGTLKFDLSLNTITSLICDYKLYKTGYLFVIDNLGYYIAHPDRNMLKGRNILTASDKNSSGYIDKTILTGGTGSNTLYINDVKHFLYFTPVSCMNWRLGIICPYDEILDSSNKLYLLLFLSLGLGLIFLLIGIVNIVHRTSYPLKQLAHTTRQMAAGQFNIKLPVLKSSSEIRELYASFRYMQQNIISYIDRLRTTMAAKEQLDIEMRLARKIQQRFLPKPIPLPANVKLVAELRQCYEVGGDMYEFFLKDNYLYFAIGDVSGKSIPAALYMASIIRFFRYIANNTTSTADICNILNKQMCNDDDVDMYITMFIGILDINTGIITFTNAGHPYPLVIYENKEINLLNKYPDVPIGVLEDHCYSEHFYTLHQDNMLLLYTDGITDAEDIDAKFYGKEKLMESIRSSEGNTPESIIERILEDLSKHIGESKQSDDLTLLTILYKGISNGC